MRPSWKEYWLMMAEIASSRADCTRRRCGAIIVKGTRSVGDPGYNGFPPGVRGCLDGACPRGRHYRQDGDACACGKPWPCPDGVPPGSSYDAGPGFCPAAHAEMNAIMRSSWDDRQNATMYVNTEPCTGCLKVIACSGITEVIWPGGRLTFPFLSCYTPG